MTNRQELKEKIIKELLPNLSVDPRGAFVKAEELSKFTYESFENYYYSGRNRPSFVKIDPESILTKEDYQEINQALIDDIKQHADEWKIEHEGSLIIIKHQSGKKHYKEGLEQQEWVEIERSIQTQQVQQVEGPKFCD